MKQLLRVLAIDDGCFKPREKGKAILVGVVSRLDGRVEGILSTTVSVDALDSTQQIIEMLEKSKFFPQVSFLLLDGVNFAGFNIVDVEELHSRLGIPVVVVFMRMPRMKRIEKALRRFQDKGERMRLLKKAGKIYPFNSINFQLRGTDEQTATQLLKKTAVHSALPEPLRLAHLIASGVSRGESTRP